MSQQPVISAWSAISPWGRRGRDFADGLSRGRPTALPLAPPHAQMPVEKACLVPDFDIRAVLGKKGTRSMDRATAMAVATIDELLGGESGQRLPGIGEGTGLTLGTSTGSVQSTMDFTRDSLVGQRPYLVDPARFPNTVMNCAAGQSAIWHRLKGPNATIAGGRATGLLALQYALRLLRAGRAEALICGAVEEFSATRAWLAWHSRGAGSAPPVLGEGAAVWLLEQRAGAAANGRAGIAEVAGLEFGFAQEAGEIRGVLADCLRRLLDAAAAQPGQVTAVAACGARGAEGESERAALADVLGGPGPGPGPGGPGPGGVGCAALIGDCHAASAAFQVAAVLATAGHGGGQAQGWLALVTSVEAGGMVGAALLRPCAPPRPPDPPSPRTPGMG